MISFLCSRTLAPFALVAIASLASAPALAHVTLETRNATAGTGYKAVFKVPHGCDGQATHTVRVEIPDGFVNVKPMPKPGWTLATQRAPYGKDYSVYGHTISEGVKEITWSEGDLPDAYYDEFVASGFVGKDVEAGPIYFKVTQTCAEGEIAWVEIPDGNGDRKLAWPAAVLKIAEAKSDGGGHGHHHHHGAAKADTATAEGSATIGALAIEGGWARATPEGAKVGAGYLTIRNTGKDADTLVSVSVPVAGMSEIHDMTITDEGVMKMRALPEGIEVPAGGSVEFKPGGMHLMFMDLKGPLTAGESLPVTLTFKSGASGQVTFPVKPIGGNKTSSDDHSGHDHGSHDDHHQH